MALSPSTYAMRQLASGSRASGSSPVSESPRDRAIMIFGNEDIPKVASVIVNKWKIGVPDLLLTFISGKSEASWWQRVDEVTAFQTSMRRLITGNGGETLFIDNGYNHGVSALLTSVIAEEEAHELVTSNLSLNRSGPRPEIRLLSIVPRTKKSDISHRPEIKWARFVRIDNPYGETGNLQISLEKQLRTELGRHVFKKFTDLQLPEETQKPPCDFVSQVVVFCNGNPEELDQIVAYVNDNIPIVVMHGTGGLADMLAFSKNRWTGQDLPELRDTIILHMRQVVQAERRIVREELYEPVINNIVTLLKSGLVRFVDITDFEALSNMDSEILTAAIEQTPRFECEYLLEKNWGLAVQSNLLELAQTMLIKQQPWRDMEIPRAALMEALVLPEREAFVDLILQQFPIRSFMSHIDYLTLFQNTVDRSFFNTRIYDPILQHNADYPINEKFILVEVNEVVYRLTSIENYINFDQLSANALGAGTDDTTSQDALTLRALIVYATLFNRVELIKILIKYCPDPIPQAIFVEHLFRGIAKYNSQPDVSAALSANASAFDNLALEIFDLGYTDSPDRCFTLLTATQPHFGHYTILELAYHAFSLNFMHYPAMRQFVDEYSYNFIEYRGQHGYIKMFLSVILIFPIYLWLSFPKLNKYSKTSPYGYATLDEPRNAQDAAAAVTDIKTRRKCDSSNHQASAGEFKRPSLPTMVMELWSSPVAKYLIWFVTYHMFLVLIGVDIMLPPCMYAGVDYAVFICTACMWLELGLRTIFEFLIGRRFNEFRRIFDLVYQTVFNVLFFLYRIEPYRETYPFAGRVILAFGVLYYYYSVWTQFLYLLRFTGAYVRLLSKNMMINLIQWFMLMAPIVISTGVVWQAIITPDWQFTGDEWRHALYRAFYTLIGGPGFYNELEYDPGCEANNRIIWSNFTQPVDAYPQDRCWLGDYNSSSCYTVTVWSYIFVIHYFLLLKLAMLTALNAYYLHTNIALLPFAGILSTYKRFEAVLGIAGRSFLPWPLSILDYIVKIATYRKSKNYDLIRAVDSEKEMQGVDRETATYWRGKAMKYFIEKELYQNA